MFTAIPALQKPALPLARMFQIFVVLAAAWVVADRIQIASGLPLWLDETWSGMIATRSDWSSFWREVWLDCNPPLYYLFLTGWVTVFGDSNLMLRLPSVFFVVCAAALPLVWRPQGLNRTGAWTWGALILFWQPGLFIMLDARGYGLMILLATISCLVVARLFEQLSRSGAALWVLIGTLMFLTHYYAAALLIGQGVLLLQRHRVELMRMWPIGLIALPGLGWFAYHLPRLQDYGRADVIWYEPTGLVSTFEHFLFVFGAHYIVAFGVVVAVVIAIVHRPPGAMARMPGNRNLVLTVCAAAIGFAVAISVGSVQPSLADRYFVPVVPAAMLGLALLTQRCARQEVAALVLTFAFFLPEFDADYARNAAHNRAIYGYEEGSEFVSLYRPDRLLFVWDHPAAKILDDASLKGIGGYFLDRADANTPTQSLIVAQDDDANEVLRVAADSERPAVIWLYNTARRSAARGHPPTFEDDPAWTCRHHHRETSNAGQLGSIACVKLGDAR